LSHIACSHCNLTFSEEMLIKEEIDGKTCYFCCKGCQGVYHLLHTKGLGSFYDKLGDRALQPASELSYYSSDLEKFDLEGFKKRYIKPQENGLYEIHLIIEGIHCFACVWLNEKVLHKTDGIIEASINYTNNKARIVWDPQSIQLSRIIRTIRSIGYNAYPYDPALQEERTVATRKTYYTRILVAVFGSMNIMWLAIAHYAGYFSGIEQSYKNILNVAQFILATPVLFYSGWIFFRGAYYGYKNNVVNMDTLVASGALLAYTYSIYAMISQKGEVYFDSVVMIITFVLVGKYLEILSKKQAVDTLDSIMGSTPTEVTVVNNGVKSLVSVENIVAGDIIQLKPGEKVVIDGLLLYGAASFDESSLTGESEPIYKQEGDMILSGSLCLDSTITYRANKDLSSSLLTSIVNLLETSMNKKPHIEQLANTVSGYFSSTILIIALLTFASWYFFIGDFEQALIIGISVIVIACPCALGLATPMATLVGVSTAAKKGILFKEAEFLETMAKSTILFLDKTGTITEGNPLVKDAHIYENFDFSLLYSLLLSSNHPIAKGVVKYLSSQYTDIQEVHIEDIQSIEAKGLSGKYKEHILIGGSMALLKERGITDNSPSSIYSQFFFAIDNKLVAYFELSDTIKEDAVTSIAAIKKMGIEIVMLTGDHEKSAKKIASQVGISQIYSKLLPQEKANIIDSYQKKGAVTVMAGDGINDAVALVLSDISIAMGSGADIAIDISDVILLEDKIKSLYEAYRVSKRTYRGIKENLGLSLLYNALAVPLAVMGFVNPLVAALSMSLSSLVVVANSLRIKKLK